MLTQIINGRILTPQGWLKDGSVLICDGKILEVTNSDMAIIGADIVDAKGMYIVPGFISMHAHGGGGHDFTEATPEAFKAAVQAHLKHGATTVVPTLSSTTFDVIGQAVKTCEELMQEPGSVIAGLHIEGPYMNRKMGGTQWGEYLKDPDPEEYIPLLESTDCIRRWDISPELPGAHDFARYTSARGILTAVTHTEAEYDEVKAAFEAGFTHAAHFYNAMPGFHKRREYKYEGTVESVFLTDGMSVEVISDGVHLPAPLLRFVYRFKGPDSIALVTDSMRGAGMPDGLSVLGSRKNGQQVLIEDGVAKLMDRSAFAGSVATTDRLVRNMIRLGGASLPDAVKMATETPARIMGFADRGRLEAGLRADLVFFDDEIRVSRTMVAGRTVFAQ